MRDIILLISLVAVSLAVEDCGIKGKALPARRYRSSDQVGKRQTIYGPLGQMAGPGEFPWQVLIKTSKSSSKLPNKLQCGGTLIAKNWVLTAAHCFSEEEAKVPSNFDVMVGVWRQYTLDGTEQEISITKIIRHNGFKKATMENDIALIELAKNADCSSQLVGMACMPNPDDDYRSGRQCWGSGWGDWLKPAPAPGRPDELQKVQGFIPRDFIVKAAYDGRYTDKIYDGMIGFKIPFFKGETSGFCSGDSGGPVVCPNKFKPHQWDIVGIISWGPSDCKGDISVLTSVTHFLNWIQINSGIEIS